MNTCSISISLHFEFSGSHSVKFMVGTVGHFTLQPMACTNHKFPGYKEGLGNLKGSEIDSIGGKVE